MAVAGWWDGSESHAAVSLSDGEVYEYNFHTAGWTRRWYYAGYSVVDIAGYAISSSASQIVASVFGGYLDDVGFNATSMWTGYLYVSGGNCSLDQTKAVSAYKGGGGNYAIWATTSGYLCWTPYYDPGSGGSSSTAGSILWNFGTGTDSLVSVSGYDDTANSEFHNIVAKVNGYVYDIYSPWPYTSWSYKALGNY
jgi:hypothetical protein